MGSSVLRLASEPIPRLAAHPRQTQSADRHDYGDLIAVLGSVLLALLTRVPHVLRSDFPLLDGGMFFAMTRDLQSASYVLPSTTSYNNAGIPFAYPPLGFYLCGLLSDLGIPLLTVFRFLPLILSVAAIVPFFLFARSLPLPRAAARAAVVAFALYPGVFGFLLSGGGVTRAPGFVFALLALWQIHRMLGTGRQRHVAGATLFAAGTVLSHPEMAWFLVYSAPLLIATNGSLRRRWLNAVAVALGAAALSSPWWITVLWRNGIGPFVAAFAGNGHDWPWWSAALSLLTLNWTAETFFPLIGGLAALGTLASLRDRRFLLPSWLVLVFLLQPRGVAWRVVVPGSLLAGVAVAEVIPQLLRRGATDLGSGRAIYCRRLTLALTAFALTLGSLSAIAYHPEILDGVSPAEREAMTWISENTPPDSRVLVITGDNWWGIDRTSEWFPVFAQRTSVMTVQGSEWTAQGLTLRSDAYDGVQASFRGGSLCLSQSASGVGEWSHVFIAARAPIGVNGTRAEQEPGTSALLRLRLVADCALRVVYDGPGGTLYERARYE